MGSGEFDAMKKMGFLTTLILSLESLTMGSVSPLNEAISSKLSFLPLMSLEYEMPYANKEDAKRNYEKNKPLRRAKRKQAQLEKKKLISQGYNICMFYDCNKPVEDLRFSLCENCRIIGLKSARKRIASGKRDEYWNIPKNHERLKKIGRETRLRQSLKDPDYLKKCRSRSKLNYAVKTGKLKKLPCKICGSKKNIHAHHHKGYEPKYALDVEWLCPKCHSIEDGRKYTWLKF